MKKNRNILKNAFKTGAKPTQSDFADLIDSFLNLEDHVVKSELDMANTNTSGLVRKATKGEVLAGNDNDKYVTPRGVRDAIAKSIKTDYAVLISGMIDELKINPTLLESLKTTLGVTGGVSGEVKPFVSVRINIDDNIEITWTHATVADKYVVMRSENGGTSFVSIGEVLTGNSKRFIDDSFLTSTMYQYKVVANTGLQQIDSNVVLIDSPAAPTVIIQIPGSVDHPWENMNRIKTFGEGMILPYKSGGWGKVATACSIPANTDFKLEYKLDNQGANDGYTQFGLRTDALFSSLGMEFGVYFLTGRFHMFELGSMHPRNHTWDDGDIFKIERIGNLTTLYINGVKIEDFISREAPALMINAYLRRYGFSDIVITFL